MTDFNSLLKNEESAVFSLRELYRSYGYLPYKMSKFEEYDLYVRNKDFLVSDSIITFNDTNGKLLALKPDVTLSIVKNCGFEKGCTQKLFYNENVYRVSQGTHAYKEIMQTGLECIGDVDVFDIAQVVSLALMSLQKISDSFVLDVSHMGVISAILREAEMDETFNKKIMACIGEKNRHEIKNICEQYGTVKAVEEKLVSLVGIYGKKEEVFDKLQALSDSNEMKEALSELSEIYDIISISPLKDKINFDFSIVNDLTYYNGVVFKGYTEGLCESVLSGGQYDELLRKMGKKGKAVGFAVYLDLLEELKRDRQKYDVDMLVLYNESSNRKMLSKLVGETIAKGKSVSVQKAVPEKLRYREKVSFIQGADGPTENRGENNG